MEYKIVRKPLISAVFVFAAESSQKNEEKNEKI